MGESIINLNELEKLRPDVKNKEEQNEIPNKTEQIQEKYRILLEPALVGAMMAINIGQTSLQNFYLRTACTVDLGHSPATCDGIVGEEIEAASQTVVSGVNISRSFVGSLIATIVLVFVGPWSDCSGRRKPLVIMPLVGMSIMSTAVLLMITFPGASTVQVLYAVQIPMSMGGNFGLLLTAAFSHIGDICHATGRDVTRTMGAHRAAVQVAHVLGAVCGPLLYRNFGFYGVFPIVLLLQLSSLLYVVLVMKDVNVNNENKVSVFNWKLPFNAIRCLLRPREGRRRMIIILMLIVGLGDRMMLSAEVLLAYMFYRLKFNWDDIMFGSFLAYRNIVSFLGTLLILIVLKRRFQLSDEVVGLLSCVSCFLATTGLIAAKTTVVVFLIAVVGIIAQGSQVVQRPILNKQILPNEQGASPRDMVLSMLAAFPLWIVKLILWPMKLPALQSPVVSWRRIDSLINCKIYSVLGALESATQILSSPMYSLLYRNTVSTIPDAWLFPAIILAVVQFLAYFTTRKLRNDKHVKKNVTEEPAIDIMLQKSNEKVEKENGC